MSADRYAALDRIRRRLEQEYSDVVRSLLLTRERRDQLEEELHTVARALDWAMHQEEENHQ